MALKGGANLVTTKCAKHFIHPLPPAGYSPLSQGESQLQLEISNWSTDAVFRFLFSPFRLKVVNCFRYRLRPVFTFHLSVFTFTCPPETGGTSEAEGVDCFSHRFRLRPPFCLKVVDCFRYRHRFRLRPPFRFQYLSPSLGKSSVFTSVMYWPMASVMMENRSA